jgi:hypothetical protein
MTMGQKLKVKLTGVDEAMGRIEFEAVRESMPGQVRVSPWQKKPAKPDWSFKSKKRRK